MKSKPALHGKITVARQETQELQTWATHCSYQAFRFGKESLEKMVELD